VPFELGELAQTRLIALAVVLAILGAWALSRAAERRRRRRFAALAASLGREVTREGESRWRFEVEVEGRPVEVRHHNQGRGLGMESSPGWQLLTVVPLRGVSELHSARIRPRLGRRRAVDPRDEDFERRFVVQDFGMPLRAGWLAPRVRAALAGFYALELPLAALDLEEARLVHRGGEALLGIGGDALRELLARQVALAEALERAI
jgi:hypothetical protein